MANYEATARTNYFGVKDEAAFREWARSLDQVDEVISKRQENGQTLFGLLFVESGMEDCYEVRVDDGEGGVRYEEGDMFSELASHLAEGHVAVLVEAGAEKSRYVDGFAIALNSEGDTRDIRLTGIYDLAKELGEHITEAAY